MTLLNDLLTHVYRAYDYRRNLNHAVVTLDPREGYWHLCGINLIDEERLL